MALRFRSGVELLGRVLSKVDVLGFYVSPAGFAF